jgi:hypothetical protein
MKSRKYPTLQEAKSELAKLGKLEYGGHEGNKLVYSLDIVGHNRYVLLLSEDGLVQLDFEVLRRE